VAWAVAVAVAVYHESCAMGWALCRATDLYLSAEWPGCHAAYC
jgi:hypothetical protein